jgi:hypothetical protein
MRGHDARQRPARRRAAARAVGVAAVRAAGAAEVRAAQVARAAREAGWESEIG